MAALTQELRIMIINAYTNFAAERQQGLDHQRQKLQQRVAPCIGVWEASIQRVMIANRSGNATLPVTSLGEDAPAEHPPSQNYDKLIVRVITERNSQRLSTMAGNLRCEISAMTGALMSVKAIQRRLNPLECSHIKEQSRDPRADSGRVVAFREQYLHKKISTPTTRPTQQACWLKNGKLFGEWVGRSARFWIARSTGRLADYNGNFDSEVFEKLFRRLCAT
ncbi:hypothetical protein PybrP1_007678 [[Pythium] brassicae (nom. inval.)]|nr:hypothetical protein PybrP1_007678 [[Pythium] brassicae (nom. inval.)]